MILRAAPAWTIITDTLCVTTSCSSDAIRERSAASARSVAARASSAARRSRAVESARRRRSTRMPRPAAAAGRTAKMAVSRPGNRGSSLPSVPATDDGDHRHHGDRQVPVPAVGDRAVGGVDGGAERDRRHVRGVHDHDRGGDHQPDADRVQPPGGERQRGHRRGGRAAPNGTCVRPAPDQAAADQAGRHGATAAEPNGPQAGRGHHDRARCRARPSRRPRRSPRPPRRRRRARAPSPTAARRAARPARRRRAACRYVLPPHHCGRRSRADGIHRTAYPGYIARMTRAGE